MTLPSNGQCASVSAYSGYQYNTHQYLQDDSTARGEIVGARLNTMHWRRKATGWFARGPSLAVQQGLGFLKVDAQVPLLQWHKHQGLWFDIQWKRQDLSTTLSQNQTFLDKQGNATALTADSEVSSQHVLQRYSGYWYESSKLSSPLNYIGGFYQTESTPVAGELSNTNANFFDGVFTGYGLMLGRIQDNRGLNFQWRLNVGKLETDFSNASTGHRASSASESSSYLMALDLHWHYRFYLAPYWYLVPHIRLTQSTILQTTAQPVYLDHSPLVYLQGQSWISLQRRF